MEENGKLKSALCIMDKKSLILFMGSIVYFAMLCYGYKELSVNYHSNWFPYNPNFIKLFYSLLWCFIIFALIKHQDLLVTNLLFEITYFFQIIPISVVYIMKDDSTLFYSTICIGMLLCELIVYYIKPPAFAFIKAKNDYWNIIFGVLLIVFILYRLINFGLPSLSALKLYSVYELRADELFATNKYWGYLQTTIVTVCIPILISKLYIQKKWKTMLLVFLANVFIYLYVGQKTYLFVGPMVILFLWFCNKPNFPFKFWHAFIAGVFVSIILYSSGKLVSFFDLFIRRVLIVPANLKFLYYDFFSTNPKLGFASIFPRWLINIPNPYSTTGHSGYAYMIGNQYFNRPDMSCDTGFIAEGFMRWGLIGIIIEFLVLSFVFGQIDRLSQKIGYKYLVGCCVYFAYGLTETHLIDQLFFGQTMVLVLYILTCTTANTQILKS